MSPLPTGQFATTRVGQGEVTLLCSHTSQVALPHALIPRRNQMARLKETDFHPASHSMGSASAKHEIQKTEEKKSPVFHRPNSDHETIVYE